jgi:hypothetical protein
MALFWADVFQFFINFYVFKRANIIIFWKNSKYFSSFQQHIVIITNENTSKQSKSRDYIIYILLKKTLSPLLFLRFFQGKHQGFWNIFLFFSTGKSLFLVRKSEPVAADWIE